MNSLDGRSLVMVLVIGAVAGWLAGIFVGHPRWGLIGSILAGLLGSIVGGWLLNTTNIKLDVGHPIANTILTSAIGAAVVIVLARILS
jgi:uncharacterized membrane protein YeaQ/YmgE (transglycosylase-associated protein family)